MKKHWEQLKSEYDGYRQLLSTKSKPSIPTTSRNKHKSASNRGTARENSIKTPDSSEPIRKRKKKTNIQGGCKCTGDLQPGTLRDNKTNGKGPYIGSRLPKNKESKISSGKAIKARVFLFLLLAFPLLPRSRGRQRKPETTRMLNERGDANALKVGVVFAWKPL